MYKIVILVVVAFAADVHSHGRLMKPPNRSSIWRVPEFASQNPPANYDDNQLYCGGLHQEQVVGGNCGVCGDPYSAPTPRANEINGQYYRGIITGRYTAGSVIDIEVDLTQAHLGYMEWRLCTTPHSGETQSCFNRYVLERAAGQGTKLPVDHGTGLYQTQLRLPAGVTCQQCVIQWNYRAGNGWGTVEMDLQLLVADLRKHSVAALMLSLISQTVLLIQIPKIIQKLHYIINK